MYHNPMHSPGLQYLLPTWVTSLTTKLIKKKKNGKGRKKNKNKQKNHLVDPSVQRLACLSTEAFSACTTPLLHLSHTLSHSHSPQWHWKLQFVTSINSSAQSQPKELYFGNVYCKSLGWFKASGFCCHVNTGPS